MFSPYADNGDLRTCADFIDEAKLFGTCSNECGYSELHKLNCCYTTPTNPCIIFPDGATAGDDFVPEYAGNSVNRATCKDLIGGATRFETGSDACGLYDIDVAYCCPSPPADDSAVTTTMASTVGTGTGVDNPCIMCPDGTSVDDFAPGADDGDVRTCADLIDEAKMYETGSDDCAWFEFKELYCCYSKPENPCNICPDGVNATAAGDFAPGADDGDFRTCADLIDEAKLYETGSNDCEWLEMYEPDCCIIFVPLS